MGATVYGVQCLQCVQWMDTSTFASFPWPPSFHVQQMVDKQALRWSLLPSLTSSPFLADYLDDGYYIRVAAASDFQQTRPVEEVVPTDKLTDWSVGEARMLKCVKAREWLP